MLHEVFKYRNMRKKLYLAYKVIEVLKIKTHLQQNVETNTVSSKSLPVWSQYRLPTKTKIMWHIYVLSVSYIGLKMEMIWLTLNKPTQTYITNSVISRN